MRKKVKTILLQDIKNLGHKYEIVEVTGGYFRNYLMPNNLAELATDKKVKGLEEIIKKEKEKREKLVAGLQKQAEKLNKETIEFNAKAKGGKLFGSVSAKDIEEKLGEEGFKNTKAELKDPIKEVGKSKVSVDLGEGVKSQIIVKISPE